MSQRSLLGVVFLAVLVVGAALWLSPKGALQSGGPAVVAVAPAMKDPLGDEMDRHDPGQVHFSMGRYPEAIAYWTQAAAKGDIAAAHRLGVEYTDGKPGVVQRDYVKSMAYHRQAAAGGNAPSMFDIGSMYEFGNGVTADIALAAKWYGYSALYGLAQGQYNYATMLETGEGVAKDEIEAYKFYILAARGGFTGIPYDNQKLRIDHDAPLPTQLMERRLSREQIADGRERAEKFKVTTGLLKVD